MQNSESQDIIGVNIISELLYLAKITLNKLEYNHTDHSDGHSDSCHADSGGYSDCSR
jgi:hypothetical protein